jgi:arylsulfatase A-like enzyme
MWRAILRSRWFFAAAVAIFLVYAVVSLVEFRRVDVRPSGTVDDILALKDRSDLNVLFILVDTVRAHHIGAYGYERETSPMFDYLADTGLLFGRHLSQSSWTKCSMASLWTGLYPIRTGVLRAQHALPESATMPAEILRDAGFRTAGLWRNGWVAPNFGFDKGFEVYDRPETHPPAPGVQRENPNLSVEGTDNDVVDAAIEFLRIHGQERWFLYLHLMDVHQYLYDEDSAVFGRGYSDIYDNAILHTDRVVGRLLAHLAKTGQLEKTLIVWTSDHGEAFYERGYEGHATTVYRETTEVPFAIGFPFKLEPGLVVESRTAGVDVWPTLLDLLGLPALPDTDGRSRVPEILAAAGRGTAPAPVPLYAHIEKGWGLRVDPKAPIVAVVDETRRLVRTSMTEGNDEEELFDSIGDPPELLDIAESEPEVVETMSALVDDYLEKPPAPWDEAAPEIELDDMELNQLRALGYKID